MLSRSAQFRMSARCCKTLGMFTLLLILASSDNSRSFAQEKPSAETGYSLLRTRPFLPADFDEQTFAALWKTWPEPQRSAAEAASLAERRRMTFERYGLMPATDDHPASKPNGPALGYVDNGKGG